MGVEMIKKFYHDHKNVKFWYSYVTFFGEKFQVRKTAAVYLIKHLKISDLLEVLWNENVNSSDLLIEPNFLFLFSHSQQSNQDIESVDEDLGGPLNRQKINYDFKMEIRGICPRNAFYLISEKKYNELLMTFWNLPTTTH